MVPDGVTMHKYEYVPIQPIAARRVEKIPFSHPRQIFPVLKILRQWSTFCQLIKSCFPTTRREINGTNDDITLNDLLDESTPTSLPVSVSAVSSPLALLVTFPIDGKPLGERIGVLENGELDLVDDPLHQRVRGLIEGVGIGVGIELLRRELSQ